MSIGKILMAIVLSFVLNFSVLSQNIPSNLKCEYLENPLGIDASRPRFTWQLNDTSSGASQQAYQLYTGTDSVEVSHGTGRIWDSGMVESTVIPAVFNGTDLQAFTCYYWAVKIRNERGNGAIYRQLPSLKQECCCAKTGKVPGLPIPTIIT